MRLTNLDATKWLLSAGYDHVWIKPHYKFNSYCYTKDGEKYATQDIYNLHDGICKGDREYIYLQLSTNRLHEIEPYLEESKKYEISIMLLAPTTKDKESRVYTGIHVVFIRNGEIIDRSYYEY